MKQFTRLYNSLGMLAMLCLASCASEELNDRLLPEGKYPMSFTTAVEGQTPTRATTDNTWNGDEQVALAIGDEVKQYIPDNTGPSASLTSTDPFYWQTANDKKTVRAWYCGQEYSSTLPESFTVQTDQSGEGYKQSDFLYASPKEVTFSDRNKAQLTFKHLPAKVVIHLTNGNGLTAKDVKNATVYLVNQATTSGAIDGNNGTVAQTKLGETEILTNVLAESVEDYQKSVQALVVPQQMQGEQFIKVTIGKDDAARDYYYTPKVDVDANLEYGKQYTYNITVKKTGLSVETIIIGPWTDSKLENNIVKETTFHITLLGKPIPDITLLGGIQQTGSPNVYETKGGSTFSFSYTVPDGEYSKGFPILKGLADLTRTVHNSGSSYTFTYTNVRSDLWLEYADCPQVGDYYYADGSWSPNYISNNSPACIGVVFKIGKGTGDVESNYGDKLPDGIRGYAVALTDATQDVCEWGERDESGGSNTPLDNVESLDNADYNGFGNTETIIEEYWNTDKWHFYDAFQAIIDYREKVNAPQNSSDWYLPSLKQLVDIYNLYKNNKGNVLYDRLQCISTDKLFREAPSGPGGPGGYWTSTEYSHADAWYIRFTNGERIHYGKGQAWTNNSYVRAILTF